MNNNESFTWFVGIFEGEGSFYFRNGVGKGLTITMTDKDVLDRVQAIAGGSIYTLKKRQEHWKDAWKWQIGGVKSAELARKMLPYLGKRRSARCSQYIESFVGTEEYLRNVKEQSRLRGQKAIELRAEGLTHKAIAEAMGVDRTTVTKLLAKYGG